MKKVYEKPGLSVIEYAAFENVFAACDKNANTTTHTCGYVPDSEGTGSSYSNYGTGNGN